MSPDAARWLENRLLEILRASYAKWKLYGRDYGYPEPAWSTARLVAALEPRWRRPPELDVPDKRFYSLVRTALERLRRRGLVESSIGVVDGRETTLWAPVSVSD
jgi:hypothetical protein